ncbi:ABC transporter ATP-binding protein [Pseudoclavibacter albus]|uniref:ABC transporter ATP-binding protein n=1 Tax=Pseudoclavibacter albus TaxID=272241 RepID=UPI0028835543|nr:ATP-binding cassette domain-containing protein [Pseudoclavibacter alba]
MRQGERVAFIGESGAGKTTLVSLLLGLYPLSAGEVFVEGMPASQLEVAKLRERIAVVFQDASLFSGTIRENISYARPNASNEEIVAAARRANAEQFIEKFPEGYDSLIGERGLKLSGGQRQRIAIARAILKDAPILVLDEATSALDTKSERLVQAGLDELMRGRTSLIIAHRLSTIASVDRIVTLRNGRIDEVGSPEELAASGGLYAELLALQNEGTAEAKKRLQAYDLS